MILEESSTAVDEAHLGLSNGSQVFSLQHIFFDIAFQPVGLCIERFVHNFRGLVYVLVLDGL